MEAFEGSERGYPIEIAVETASEGIGLQVRSELIATLQDLIDNDLTEKQRLAIRAFLSGFSTDGIAERIGTNRNAVYKLIHDARNKLKQGLEDSGISADDYRSAFD